MAPEFIPLIVCALLIMGTVVAGLLFIVSVLFPNAIPRVFHVFMPNAAPTIGSLRIVLLISTAGLVLFTAVCAMQVRQVYFLEEGLAGAAAQGNLEEVQGLLDRGASPDSWGADHLRPAIVYAAFNGHGPVVALLLKRGADPNLRDFEGRTALSYAREHGNPQVIQILTNAGAQE